MEKCCEILDRYIRDVPDFPKKGIVFKDITPLLADASALALAVEMIANPFRNKKVELVVGAESRGFIFGMAVAQALSVGFVPIRKPGKLPAKTIKKSYDLEYGTDSLEIHADAVKPGQKVLMVDDLLATGGTMRACCDLVKELGGDIVGVTFLIELAFLHGRDKLKEYEVCSVIKYD
jgi:adenine phosphoribosyltransferase